MRPTLNFNSSIQLSLNQLVDLAKQLSPKDRVKLVSILLNDEEFITKAEAVSKIKTGLEEVKLHKEGKIKLRTLSEFLIKTK
jgi:DNA replicative helicase MCM subunit Mcm2 (Cdc46/Mcm family)